MKAEIIAVGTELLLGQVVNTNATFLSEELASLGMDVYYHSVVGDNEQRLEDLLQLADKRSDLVVLCGGLGPTEDDLTKQVVAKHVGRNLVIDEEAHHKLVSFFAKRERSMTENNLLQALYIEGGESLSNRTGLAVGIFYQSNETKTSYLLVPGPPNELRPMIYEQAIPLLSKHFLQEEQLISRVLRFYGIGESELVTRCADLIQNQTNPTIAPYAKPHEVTIRLTVKSKNQEEAKRLLDESEAVLMDRAGDYFYGYGETNSLVNVVVDALKKQKKTVTVAESITVGLVQSTLGDVPGVSTVFPGGFVVYSEQMKQQLLGIAPELMAKEGTVSQACVEEMALKAKELAATDYALAFSGVAGPDPIEGQEVGTVWMALATPNGVSSKKQLFARDRRSIRSSSVMAGLDYLRRELLGENQ